MPPHSPRWRDATSCSHPAVQGFLLPHKYNADRHRETRVASVPPRLNTGPLWQSGTVLQVANALSVYTAPRAHASAMVLPVPLSPHPSQGEVSWRRFHYVPCKLETYMSSHLSQRSFLFPPLSAEFIMESTTWKYRLNIFWNTCLKYQVSPRPPLGDLDPPIRQTLAPFWAGLRVPQSLWWHSTTGGKASMSSVSPVDGSGLARPVAAPLMPFFWGWQGNRKCVFACCLTPHPWRESCDWGRREKNRKQTDSHLCSKQLQIKGNWERWKENSEKCFLWNSPLMPSHLKDVMPRTRHTQKTDR